MEEAKQEQEKLEGEVFELREPPQRNSHFNIEVIQNGKTDQYLATLSPSLYGEGRTLAESLHQLGNRLDGLRIYGSELYDPEHLVGGKLRKCDYCGASIFFALTPNEKWMPVDGKTVLGKELSGQRAFVIIDVAGKPHVRALSNPDGEVWIPHPEVCGAKQDAPVGKVLIERWEQNRGRTIKLEETLVADLQELVYDLEKGTE